jgi:hypothetical protein
MTLPPSTLPVAEATSSLPLATQPGGRRGRPCGPTCSPMARPSVCCWAAAPTGTTPALTSSRPSWAISLWRWSRRPPTKRILAGQPSEARHLRELFTASSGSLEACALRLAEYLPATGYVVIADPTERRIRFATPSPTASYQWGRHTPLPDQHSLWRAPATGAFRGQGEGLSVLHQSPNDGTADRYERQLPALRRQHLGLHRLPEVW